MEADSCSSNDKKSINMRNKKEERSNPELMKQFWQEKKRLYKERRKRNRDERAEAEQKKWEELSEEEKLMLKEKASVVHEERRNAELKAHEERVASLANPSVPKIIFDLHFASVMNEAGMKSTAAQIKYSYSLLKHAGFPLVPLVFGGEGKEIEQSLRGFEGFKKYPMPIHSYNWWENNDNTNVVYLTADSPNVLTSIDENCSYVVGAFVDHNAKKNLTFEHAEKLNVKTAKLPLDEHMKIGNMCKVLTINHVVDVLAKYCKTHNWVEAFSGLPTRRRK